MFGAAPPGRCRKKQPWASSFRCVFVHIGVRRWQRRHSIHIASDDGGHWRHHRGRQIATRYKVGKPDGRLKVASAVRLCCLGTIAASRIPTAAPLSTTMAPTTARKLSTARRRSFGTRRAPQRFGGRQPKRAAVPPPLAIPAALALAAAVGVCTHNPMVCSMLSHFARRLRSCRGGSQRPFSSPWFWRGRHFPRSQGIRRSKFTAWRAMLHAHI